MEGSPYAKTQVDSSSRFDTIPACERRTGRRTRDNSIYRASRASRGKSMITVALYCADLAATLRTLLSCAMCGIIKVARGQSAYVCLSVCLSLCLSVCHKPVKYRNVGTNPAHFRQCRDFHRLIPRCVMSKFAYLQNKGTSLRTAVVSIQSTPVTKKTCKATRPEE